jgi:hypothetical protein
MVILTKVVKEWGSSLVVVLSKEDLMVLNKKENIKIKKGDVIKITIGKNV